MLGRFAEWTWCVFLRYSDVTVKGNDGEKFKWKIHKDPKKMEVRHFGDLNLSAITH